VTTNLQAFARQMDEMTTRIWASGCSPEDKSYLVTGLAQLVAMCVDSVQAPDAQVEPYHKFANLADIPTVVEWAKAHTARLAEAEAEAEADPAPTGSRCVVLPNGQGPSCDWDPACVECRRRATDTLWCVFCKATEAPHRPDCSTLGMVVTSPECAECGATMWPHEPDCSRPAPAGGGSVQTAVIAPNHLHGVVYDIADSQDAGSLLDLPDVRPLRRYRAKTCCGAQVGHYPSCPKRTGRHRTLSQAVADSALDLAHETFGTAELRPTVANGGLVRDDDGLTRNADGRVSPAPCASCRTQTRQHSADCVYRGL